MSKSLKNITGNTNLIWVYPQNKWISNYKKTFVYGWSNPSAKLFIEVNDEKTKVKKFPNGNFAHRIKLPKKENTVKLIQILNGKKKIVSRTVIVKGAKFDEVILDITKEEPISHTIPKNVIDLKDLVIVIDPGHGGKEHGTHSPKGISESYFNLQVANSLFKKLKEISNRVYLTRTEDEFVSLKQRVDFAKKKKCDFLISIHHNALPDNEDPLKHRGVGIYYTHDFVEPFAQSLLESISKNTGLKKYGVFKRNFALTSPDFCHAVLIECGFLIHPEEAEIITKKKTQEKIVDGIVEGIFSLLT